VEVKEVEDEAVEGLLVEDVRICCAVIHICVSLRYVCVVL